MNKFIEFKELHWHPSRTQDIAEQVQFCTKRTVEALEKSEPCRAMQQEFQTCLESGQRTHYKCAKQYKEQLEMCAAKYIGKLD
jgi:hypothetical protein